MTDMAVSSSHGNRNAGLSVFFTVLCIIDLFGVFPIVALPKSVIACGVYGAPLVMFVLGLQLYTASLLGRSWLSATRIAPHIDQKIRYPYAAVAELAFGRRMRQLVTFFIDATVFGAGVPNILVASQSLQLFWWKITGGGVGVSFCLWMLLIGLILCPVMWLGSPKDMKPLAAISVLIVTTVAISTWCCIILDNISPRSTDELLNQEPSLQDFLTAYGIIAFQFDIHPMLLTIQVDMKDNTKMNIAMWCGFLVTGFMFAVTTLLAAYRYGKNVQANILQGIPASVPLFIVALLVTLQLCLSSAVGNSALFQHVEELLRVPRDFTLRRCIVRSTIVAFAVFLGEAVPRFDLVMGLIGSTLTGPLMFIFPPLLFLKLCYMKRDTFPMYQTTKEENANTRSPINRRPIGIQNVGNTILPPSKYRTTYRTFPSFNSNDSSDEVKWYDIMIAFVAMLVGITATVVATYSSWSEVVNYAAFSTPCIVNASAAARDFLQVTTKE